MTTTRQFDLVNRLKQIGTILASVATINSFAYGYNPADQRTAITNADSSRWAYAYDRLGQVTNGVRYWSDNTPVAGQQFAYGFDQIGNRKWEASGGNEWGSGLRYENYTANDLNQSTRRSEPGYFEMQGSAAANATVTVQSGTGVTPASGLPASGPMPTYRKGEYFRAELRADNSSGPVWASVTNLGVLRAATNSDPDITATNIGHVFVAANPEIYLHDADGNLTNNGRWAMIWDAENRLVEIRSRSDAPAGSQRKVVWTYDGLGRRVRETAYDRSSGSDVVLTDVAFVYDGWRCVAELNATNQALIRSYVWGQDLSGSLGDAGGVGGLLGIKPAGAGTHFYTFDGNGNVAALVNATNSNVSAVYEYGPFGTLLRATGPMAYDNPYRFSTKRQEFHSGLSLYEYRPYDAETGRWWTRDPLEEWGGVNLYGAFLNEPPNIFDSDGRDNIYHNVNAYPGYSLSVQNAPVNVGFNLVYEMQYNPAPRYFVAPGSTPPRSVGSYSFTGNTYVEATALGTDPAAEYLLKMPQGIGASYLEFPHGLIERLDLSDEQKARLHYLAVVGPLVVGLAVEELPCTTKNIVYRELSAADRAALEAGQPLVPKGTVGTVLDHVRGQPTGHISASETIKGTARFNSGNGLVAIDVDTVTQGGTKFIPHTEVLEGVGARPKQIQKVLESGEVMFEGPIPPSAVTPIRR